MSYLIASSTKWSISGYNELCLSSVVVRYQVIKRWYHRNTTSTKWPSIDKISYELYLCLGFLVYFSIDHNKRRYPFNEQNPYTMNMQLPMFAPKTIFNILLRIKGTADLYARLASELDLRVVIATYRYV